MKLFHYHHWTDCVEETEQFYTTNGFRTAGRFGTERTYHPPLTWEDFRNEQPLLRIVEVRKDQVNVTFGRGNRPMFDHIGWLVSKNEHDVICEHARKLGWNVNSNERRTFIGTPFHLRLELQQHDDAIDTGTCEICFMDITVKETKYTDQLPKLFGHSLPELRFQRGARLALERVVLKNMEKRRVTDPQGVMLQFI
ncbi:MAG TPA: hypothetical protein VFK37_01435 [Bacillales bacterium]|nr:hypothetical protein [Bacillales bacterium]